MPEFSSSFPGFVCMRRLTARGKILAVLARAATVGNLSAQHAISGTQAHPTNVQEALAHLTHAHCPCATLFLGGAPVSPTRARESALRFCGCALLWATLLLETKHRRGRNRLSLCPRPTERQSPRIRVQSFRVSGLGITEGGDGTRGRTERRAQACARGRGHKSIGGDQRASAGRHGKHPSHLDWKVASTHARGNAGH